MKRFINFILIFMLSYLAMRMLFPQVGQVIDTTTDLVIETETELTRGKPVVLNLRNNTAEDFVFTSDCPAEPFSVSKYENGKYLPVTADFQNGHCDERDLTIAANGGMAQVSYQIWQRELFATPGKWRVEIPVTVAGEEKNFFQDIEIVQPGFFGTIWETLVYRPLYNGLIFFAKVLPSHSFGWSIIALTVVIRLVLLVPFQKSMRAQRKMQQIQPQLEEIREKYKDNQQLVATETMALFKSAGVNPFSSCLPILLQLPFLIAFFWIVRDGLAPNFAVLLYEPLQSFDFGTVTTDFYWFDLTAPGAQLFFILPIMLAVVQFVQMQLTLVRTKKAQKNQKKSAQQNPMAESMAMMTKWMPYFMPAMIGFIAISLPSGVGLYWGTSAFFGIFQQLFANWQVDHDDTPPAAPTPKDINPKKPKKDVTVIRV